MRPRESGVRLQLGKAQMRHGTGHRKTAGGHCPCNCHVCFGAESTQDFVRPFAVACVSLDCFYAAGKICHCSVDINYALPVTGCALDFYFLDFTYVRRTYAKKSALSRLFRISAPSSTELAFIIHSLRFLLRHRRECAPITSVFIISQYVLFLPNIFVNNISGSKKRH